MISNDNSLRRKFLPVIIISSSFLFLSSDPTTLSLWFSCPFSNYLKFLNNIIMMAIIINIFIIILSIRINLLYTCFSVPRYRESVHSCSIHSRRFILSQMKKDRVISGYCFPLFPCCNTHSRTRHLNESELYLHIKTTTNKSNGILFSNSYPSSFLFLSNDQTTIRSFVWFCSCPFRN